MVTFQPPVCKHPGLILTPSALYMRMFELVNAVSTHGNVLVGPSMTTKLNSSADERHCPRQIRLTVSWLEPDLNDKTRRHCATRKTSLFVSSLSSLLQFLLSGLEKIRRDTQG